MEEYRLKLRKNLRLMYYANGLMAVGMVMIILPVVGLIMMVVACVMELVGLVRLRTVHRYYMNAVVLVAVGFLITLLPNGEGVLGFCLSLIGGAIGLLRFRCVIQATNSCLIREGQEELAAKGNRVWKYQFVLTVGTMIFEFFGTVMIVPLILEAVVLLVSLVLSVVMLGINIDYLEKSSKVFA